MKDENEFKNKEPTTILQKLSIENSIDGFLFSNQIGLLKKFYKNSLLFRKSSDLTTGIKPYQTNKGKPPQSGENVKIKFLATEQIDELFKPYLIGKNITRYNIDYST